MEEDNTVYETLDELHESILSLCEEDDELLVADCTEQLETDTSEQKNSNCLSVSTPESKCRSKEHIEDEKLSFHLSPAKMSGIQLPVLENKRLSCLQTPLTLAGLSPIISRSATPNIKSSTPYLKMRIRHFSSTPYVGPYQPKRLALNETEQSMMTISEESDILSDPSKIVEKNKSTNQVSKIKIDSLCSDKKDEPVKDGGNIHDENYFKELNTTIETARFSQINYSKTEVVEDEHELTADILGLEKFIVLDTISQEEDDLKLDLTVSDDDDTIINNKNSTVIETINKETNELGSTTIFGAETIPIKSSILLEEDTIAVNCTMKGKSNTSLKRKLEDDVDENLTPLKSEDSASNPKKWIKKENSPTKSNVATVSPMVHNVHVPILDDSVVEVIMVDESIEVIDISDDSVDCTVLSKAIQSSAACSTAVSTAASCPSIVTTPITSSLSRPQPSVSPSQPLYTLNEEELMKLVKSKWGTDPVHDVNNNLTTCFYRNKQTPNGQMSILEGNFRIPPLLRSSINKNDLQIKGQGKTPTEIANSINKQLTHIENDCHNKILGIEGNKEIRILELKQVHRGQIQMLRQRQIEEMRSIVIRSQMDPNNYWFQCRKLQLHADHDNQKIDLQYQHNVEMRGLLNEIEGEKEVLIEQARKSKNNLTQIKEKLEAATNQNPIDPDMVHTTIDLYKGPCKSNGQKQSLVQVCLPADVASYMIREEEMYNMTYKYKK